MTAAEVGGRLGLRQRHDSAEAQLAALLSIQALITQVSSTIGPALELAPVLRTVLVAIRSRVDFSGGGSICLVDEWGVRMAASDPEVSPEVLAARVPIGTGLAGRVVSTGAPIYSPELDGDERVDQTLRRLGTNARMRSYLAVPLVCDGKVTGLLQVDAREPDAFDEHDLQVLTGLASAVSGSIESARRHESAQELERLKSDFIGRVSHELRTPLTIIGGLAQTMREHQERLSADDQRAMLTRIEAASKRLGDLVTELLTVGSVEAGAGAGAPRPVVVSEVLAAVRDDATEPDLVTVTCPPDLMAWCDPRVLGQALNQLVQNALAYAGDAHLSACALGDGRHVEVAVDDTGPGVAPDQREKIWERFARGQHTLPGMGLGLPLVRSLVTSQAGTVGVTSSDRGGARFWVRLRTPDAVIDLS